MQEPEAYNIFGPLSEGIECLPFTRFYFGRRDQGGYLAFRDNSRFFVRLKVQEPKLKRDVSTGTFRRQCGAKGPNI